MHNRNHTVTAAAILAAFIAAGSLADTFSGRLLILPQWTHAKTIGASTVSETFAELLNWTHTSGASTNQMNVIVRESVTLTNAQTRTIDLAGGVSDSFGDVTTFTTVRFLCLVADEDNADPVALGASGEDAWAAWCGGTNHTVTIRPGGILLLTAPDSGYTITDSKLMVRNTGTNAAAYSIYIGGAE